MNSADLANFVAALDELEGLKAEIAELTRREDGDYRYEVVQRRRVMSQTLGQIGTIGERLFAGTDDIAAFRENFSKLRSTTAVHQANWPAVRLGERREEFLASAEPMRQAGTDFVAWARAALLPGA